MSLAESFAHTGFARFINSRAGRVTRIVAGLVFLAGGYAQRHTSTGVALMALSLVPLVAGGLDWCLVSALLGGPISGATLRKTGQPPSQV